VPIRSRVRPKKSRETKTQAAPAAVVLVGFMGAGKSSVGRALGQRLGWKFEDLDEQIEGREGRTISEIFRDSGEAEFRRAEHEVLCELLRNFSAEEPKVIALGGGTFAQGDNHRAIQESGVQTVFLHAPLNELWQRCTQQANLNAKRPLQTSENKFREQYKGRLQYYQTASLRIETEGKQVEAIAAEIAQALDQKARDRS
jgi:shikimate kinase